MSQQEYFKHYEGQEPFVFISYAHADSNEVMRIITDMHSRGFRVWYDEGIEAGEEWQECIAEHLFEADLMIAFISNAYMKSDNCRKEMSYALSKKKKVINIFLEETYLSPGMELQLGNIFALMKYTYPSEGYFYAKFYGAELFKQTDYGCKDITVNVSAKIEKEVAREKKRKEHKRAREIKNNEPRVRKKWIVPLIIGIVVFGLALAALIVGYFTGYLQRFTTQTVQIQTLAGDTIAEFNNPIFENIAAEYTDINDGNITVADLAGLTSLYIVGDKYWFNEPLSNVIVSGTVVTDGYVTDSSGVTVSVKRGDIKNLSDLAYFTSLTTVWIQFESITSLETLPACGIEYLNISGNKVTSLNGICNLPKLQTFVAEGCPISNVDSLNQCLDLKEINLLGSDISDFSIIKNLVKLDSLKISNCTLDELHPALMNNNLKSIYLQNCNLRGEFFKEFDAERKITTISLDNCTLDSLIGIDRFSRLSVMMIYSCKGISDWTELNNAPTLCNVYVNDDMVPYMKSIMGTATFSIEVE